MEYTKFKYDLFKLNAIFSDNFLFLVIGLVVLITVGYFFYFDFKNNGKNFVLINFKSIKAKNFIIIIFSFMLCIGLFVFKNKLSHTDPPQAVVESNDFKVTKNVEVLSVDKHLGKAKVTTNKKKKHGDFIVNIYNQGSEKKPSTLKYDPNKKISISKGSKVSVKSKLYTWKYKNHEKFGYDKFAKNQFKLLNSGKVNGYVYSSN